MDDFLLKFNINKEDFEKTELKWDALMKIKEDYIKFKKNLPGPAKFLVDKFQDAERVHSVKYRLKNPDKLIAKIIKKKIKDSDRLITLENYKEEITDLIGLRILNLLT